MWWLIFLLLVIFAVILIWYVSIPSTQNTTSSLRVKNDNSSFITDHPKKYENLYIKANGDEPLYLYWKNKEYGGKIYRILALTPSREEATPFTLNFFNPEFVKPFSLRSNRFAEDSENYIKENRLDKVVYLTSDLPTEILHEMTRVEGKLRIKARIHMCGAHGYVTVNKNKELGFDGYDDKTKKRDEKVEFTIESDQLENINKDFERVGS